METYITLLPYFEVFGTADYPPHVYRLTETVSYRGDSYWVAEVTTEFQGEQVNYEEYQVHLQVEPMLDELTQRALAAIGTYNEVLSEARDQYQLDPTPSLQQYINELIAGKDKVRTDYQAAKAELNSIKTFDALEVWEYPVFDVPPPFL